MASRLLARLDQAIAKARNPVDVACLQAERAGFLARQGHLDAAQALIDQLQQQFTWRPHAAVSAWLSLAQGLHDHYSRLGASAHDRIRRAHALSGAAHLAPLHALSAAWLAHMDYVRDDMAQMVRHVHAALTAAAPDHHSARSRATLVVAEAYHFAGEAERAQPWYARSRHHASADGDEAHLSALMHNQAALRVSQVRLAALFGDAADDAARQALLVTESTGHFDAGIGTASLHALVPMLRAQVLVLHGRFDEALALFDAHLEAAMAEGLGAQRGALLAERAWCCWRLGRADDAREAAAAALASLDQVDTDDRALAQARLAQLHEALGDAAQAGLLQRRARADLQAHRRAQQRLVALLDETLVGIAVATA